MCLASASCSINDHPVSWASATNKKTLASHERRNPFGSVKDMCVEGIEQNVGEKLKAVEDLSGEDWMQSRKGPVAVLYSEPTGVALKSLRYQPCFFEASMVPFVQTRCAER